MIITADFGSIIFQIFIIWLLSSLFSGKKKKTEKKKSFIKPILKDIYNSLAEIGEKKLAELNIIPNEKEIHPEIIHSEEIQKEESKINEIPPQEVGSKQIIFKERKRSLKSQLGLHSKSKIKNAIILNEVLGKPVSFRK